VKNSLKCKLRMCKMVIVYNGPIEVEKDGTAQTMRIKGDWEVKECQECGRQIAVLK